MLPCANIGQRQATFHSAQCHRVTTVTHNQFTSITAANPGDLSATQRNSTQLSATQHKLHPPPQTSLLCILLFLRLFQCCLQMRVSLKALGAR